MTIKRSIILVFFAIMGLVIGVVTALWGIGYFDTMVGRSNPYEVGNNYWSGDPAIGSSDSDPYTRARIARTGLLALSRKEAIYFFRDRDDAGERLREGCRYRMSGGPLPARWWSVTLYAADDYLAVNEDKAASISSEIGGLDDSAWTVPIGTEDDLSPPGMSSRNAGEFSLTLRLYNPDQRAVADASGIPFPKVDRISCGDQVT